MPRPERPLDNTDDPLTLFAHELRKLRSAAGSPPYRQLARDAHYSTTALADAAGGRTLPSLAVTLAYARACGGDTAEWEQRWHETNALLTPLARDHRTDSENLRPPYLGLSAFQITDADRFFGRATLTETLLARIRRHRLVAVLGASGSGKSSLLRAGLAGADNRPTMVFTPGAHPVEECAAHLAAFADESAAVLRREFTNDPTAMHLRVRQALADHPADTDLLLVVDQFEELFTLCADAVERQAFITGLAHAATAPRSQTRVVLGVRSDFFAHCAHYPELQPALGEGQVLVGPMTAEELREAITKPAAAANCTVESALLARLVAEATNQPGTLPLVSHALLETWRRRQGMTLTLAGYEQAGGIQHALARTAETVFSGFDETQQAVTRQLLLRLTALGEGTEDTKRRVARREVDDTQTVRGVLAALADARLVTLDQDSVAIAHEALISHWPRLREWLAADRDGLRVHRQLTEATDVWEALDHDPGALYRGTRLTLAQEWAAACDSVLSQRESRFLAASVTAETAASAAARRRTRRLRQLVALLSVLLVIAATGAVALAQAERTIAQQRDHALVQNALSTIAAQRGGNPPLAAQLALAAYRLEDTPQTRGAVLSVLAQPYATVLSDHRGAVTSVGFDPIRYRFASGGVDGTVVIRDVVDPHHPTDGTTITIRGHVVSQAFSHDGRLTAVVGDSGAVTLMDNTGERTNLAASAGPSAFSPDDRVLAIGGDTIRLCDVRQHTVFSDLPVHAGALAFTPDGRTLLAADTTTVWAWDVSDPAHPRALGPVVGQASPIQAIALAPDGRTLAVAGADATATLWDIVDHRQLSVLAGHSGAVTAVAFAPDGRSVATGSADLTVRWWDTTDTPTPGLLAVLPGPQGPVTSVAFSPDGRTLGIGGADGTSRLQDLPVLARRGLTDITAAAVSADGSLLAMSAVGGGAALWDISRPDTIHQVAALPDRSPDLAAAFARAGHLLATSNEDTTVSLWDTTHGSAPTALAQLPGDQTPITVLALSQDGRLLAAAGADGNVRLWDVADPRHPQRRAVLPHSRMPVFSPDARTLAALDPAGTVTLWDIATPGNAHVTAHVTAADGVPLATFAFDGRHLAAAASGVTAAVRLWDVGNPSTPRPVSALPLTAAVAALALSPDGTTLAISQVGAPLRLVDITSPDAPGTIADLDGETAPIVSLAFSPNGHTLIATDLDNIPRLWETRVDQAATRICARAWPPLDHARWDQYFPGLPYAPPCGGQ